MTAARVPIPREHGAWGVLLASLLLAYAHAWARSGAMLLLGALFLLSFAVQEPLGASSWGGRAGGGAGS